MATKAKEIKKFVYKVYHGWAFPEYITEFNTMKKAVAFIENQEDSDCWCFEKVCITELNKGGEGNGN